MLGQRFRLNAPKIGLVFQEGRKVAVQIPAGAEILAIDSVADPVTSKYRAGQQETGSRPGIRSPRVR